MYMWIPFSPTNGNDHVKTSMKLGSQYGWGLQLNWRMFMTLFSYFNTAAYKGIKYIIIIISCTTTKIFLPKVISKYWCILLALCIELIIMSTTLALYFKSYLVVIDIQVIWCRKNRYQRWKPGCLTLPIHTITEKENGKK